MLEKTATILILVIIGFQFLLSESMAQGPDISDVPDIQLHLDIDTSTPTITATAYETTFDLGEEISVLPMIGNDASVYACIGGEEKFMGFAKNGERTEFKLPSDNSFAGTTVTLKFRDRKHNPGSVNILLGN